MSVASNRTVSWNLLPFLRVSHFVNVLKPTIALKAKTFKTFQKILAPKYVFSLNLLSSHLT